MNTTNKDTGGIATAWLQLINGKSGGIDDQNFLAPHEPATRPAGDVLDAARDCIQELGWTVDDAKGKRPAHRQQWDCTLQAAIQAHSTDTRRALGLASLQAHNSSVSKQRFRFLGALLSRSGTHLESASAFFTSVIPVWFTVLEESLGVSTLQRGIAMEWRTSGALTSGKGQAGSRATEWSRKTRVASLISTIIRPADPATDSAEFRQKQLSYAQAHDLTYESMSDGTGGGKAAGFAWQVTVDLENPDQHLYREAGRAVGLVRADTSELAGMVRQLQKAPDRPGVRLCSDCNGVLLMIYRARTLRPQRVLRHAQRVLLREWLELEAGRKYAVRLGWARGHTAREDFPFAAQRWCDDNALLCAREEVNPVISMADGRFVLLNQEDQPVLGSWKVALRDAGQELMRQQAQTDTRSAVRGEVQWMQLEHLFVHSEWNATPLIGRTSAAAKLRFNAQSDTIMDPWGELWTLEQKAKEEGTLGTLRRTCRTCHQVFFGPWEAHGSAGCLDFNRAWALAEAVLVNSWAQEVAWDFQEVFELPGRHRASWLGLCEGSTWNGFTLAHRTIGQAPLARGLAAEDWFAGKKEPDVLDPSTVHAAAVTWALEHPEEAEIKARGAKWQQHVPVLRSNLDSNCTIIPAKLFELWETWTGPPELFEAAVILHIHRAQDAHAADSVKAGGFDDYWTCITSL